MSKELAILDDVYLLLFKSSTITYLYLPASNHTDMNCNILKCCHAGKKPGDNRTDLKMVEQ